MWEARDRSWLGVSNRFPLVEECGVLKKGGGRAGMPGLRLWVVVLWTAGLIYLQQEFE